MSRRRQAALLALTLLSACFTPDYDCRILCGTAPQECPTGFHCVSNGAGPPLCALEGRNSCSTSDLVDAVTEAGNDATSPPDMTPVVDASMIDANDAAGPDMTLAPIRDAGAVDATENEAGSPPPTELCYGSTCLSLSPALRQGLVLWLDPSNLPPPGSNLDVWHDRSGQGNNAYTLNPQTMPGVVVGGVELPQTVGGGLSVPPQQSLDVGAGDFLVMVVGRMNEMPPSCLLRAGADARGDSRLLALAWDFQTPLRSSVVVGEANEKSVTSARTGLADQRRHLMILRRASTTLELRIDGASEGTATLTSGETVGGPFKIYLGTCGEYAAPVAALNGVAIVRGSVDQTDLAKLEAFALAAYAL